MGLPAELSTAVQKYCLQARREGLPLGSRPGRHTAVQQYRLLARREGLPLDSRPG